MTTRVLFLNQWPQREVVILMEITLRQVFIYYISYDILHLSQIKNQKLFFINIFKGYTRKATLHSHTG